MYSSKVTNEKGADPKLWGQATVSSGPNSNCRIYKLCRITRPEFELWPCDLDMSFNLLPQGKIR